MMVDAVADGFSMAALVDSLAVLADSVKDLEAIVKYGFVLEELDQEVDQTRTG